MPMSILEIDAIIVQRRKRALPLKEENGHCPYE